MDIADVHISDLNLIMRCYRHDEKSVISTKELYDEWLNKQPETSITIKRFNLMLRAVFPNVRKVRLNKGNQRGLRGVAIGASEKIQIPNKYIGSNISRLYRVSSASVVSIYELRKHYVGVPLTELQFLRKLKEVFPNVAHTSTLLPTGQRVRAMQGVKLC